MTAVARPTVIVRRPGPGAGRTFAAMTTGLDDVSPRLLRCFTVLGDELHFGRASDRLFMAQPALSRAIQRLERSVGRPLFERSTRAVGLTPSGQALLPRAQEVLDALDALRDELATARGLLRVAHAPGCDTMAVVLDRAHHVDPALRVQERVLDPGAQRAELRAGRLDVAICAEPAPGDGALASAPLRLDPLLVGVVGRAPGERRPVDVRRRTVAAPQGGDDGGPFARFLAGYEQAVGARFRRVAVAFGSGTEAFALRRAGAGAFLMLGSHGVRLDTYCPLVGAAPLQAYFPWHVVWRRGAPEPVRAFVAAAQGVAADRRWLDPDRLDGEPWTGAQTPAPEPERVAAPAA
jgi:DNA-binding transcriptional LysR family regulator